MPGALGTHSATAERVGEQPEVGLRERKKARLRQLIIDTSIKLFRKHGYEDTRIDDIVHTLEISQPTFFRYFPSKDAVLREVGNAVMPASANGCGRSFPARRKRATACGGCT